MMFLKSTSLHIVLLLSGFGNIDDKYRNQNDKWQYRDHLVGQLNTWCCRNFVTDEQGDSRSKIFNRILNKKKLFYLSSSSSDMIKKYFKIAHYKSIGDDRLSPISSAV